MQELIAAANRAERPLPPWQPRVISRTSEAVRPAPAVMHWRALQSRLFWVAWNRGFVLRSALRIGLCAVALLALEPWMALLAAVFMLGTQLLLDAPMPLPAPLPAPRRPLLRSV